LILLSPTVHGMVGLPLRPSPMEDSLKTVFSAVAGRPKLAEHFVEAFRDRVASPDWGTLAKDLPLRGRTFANLPASSHTDTLLRPFATAESLANYGSRVIADVSTLRLERLAEVEAKILLITGDFDGVVNNDTTRSALRRCRAGFTEARISGAGHYIHDLQYPYFRLLLDRHFRPDAQPNRASRLEIIS